MREEKILIVEDERIIALDLKKRLERFGYPAPEIVSSGEEAISAAREYAPAIILMDIMLGGKTDGIDAAKTIQKEYNIPVIFLTAYSNEQTLERAKEAEPYGYILKPFKERELYTTIDIALYKFKLNTQLKSQERWLSAILHSIEDGIIATGNNGAIQFMNPIAEKLTGWSEEEARDHSIEEVFPLTQDTSKQRISFPHLHSGGEDDFPFGFSDCTITNKRNETVHVEGTLGRITDRQDNIEGQVLAFRDITEMQRLSDTISYQASHDALTGLANREEFSERLQRLIEDSHQHASTHALIVLDIDQFKVVNDIAGHTAGDELLLKTTSVIKTVVRSSDLCARLGADEFGILLEGATKEQTMEIAKRLQSRLKENRLIWDKHVFNINTSIGVVLIDEESGNLHAVLAAADDACFVAKDAGGNKIRVYNYNESLFHQRRGEMQWISHLTKALEENRFILYHQPIVSLGPDEQEYKSELLIRMVDTEGEIVMPADFIPAAERYNLMPAIDRWVIQSAFRNYKLLTDKLGLDKMRYNFTINLSTAFLADENALDFLVYEFKQFDIPPEAFCFEITETAAISNMKAATNFITEVKKTGATFALDDFGSGFSSFNYLRQLPVDYLKIDGTFVKNMHEDHINHAMVEAIHSLGRFIGIKTIAEFAANEEIITRLKQIGVHYAQGYHLGRPTPLDHLIDEL
jgi:diguanylate cyclase (GGDEF)-like protein/PAS domain S-box-containing protein